MSDAREASGGSEPSVSAQVRGIGEGESGGKFGGRFLQDDVGPNQVVLEAQARVCTGPTQTRPLGEEEMRRVLEQILLSGVPSAGVLSAKGELPPSERVSRAQMGAFFAGMTVRSNRFPPATQWSEGERRALVDMWPALRYHLPRDVLFLADPQVGSGLVKEYGEKPSGTTSPGTSSSLPTLREPTQSLAQGPIFNNVLPVGPTFFGHGSEQEAQGSIFNDALPVGPTFNGHGSEQEAQVVGWGDVQWCAGSIFNDALPVGPTFNGHGSEQEAQVVGDLRDILFGVHLGFQVRSQVESQNLLPMRGGREERAEGVSDALVAAYLIAVRMNRETDRELKAFCLAFDQTDRELKAFCLAFDQVGWWDASSCMGDMGWLSDALVAAYLIAVRMNRETDRDLKVFCLAFDQLTLLPHDPSFLSPFALPPRLSSCHQEMGPAPIARVPSLTHYGDPYDGSTRYFRPTLFVAAVRASCGEACLLHGVDAFPPKLGATEEAMLSLLGANTSLSPSQAAAILEDPQVHMAYLSLKDCSTLPHGPPQEATVVPDSPLFPDPQVHMAYLSLKDCSTLPHGPPQEATVVPDTPLFPVLPVSAVHVHARRTLKSTWHISASRTALLSLMLLIGIRARGNGLVVKGEEGSLAPLLTASTRFSCCFCTLPFIQHQASGREAMVAGFYHEGYEEPLLMLMRRQPVEAGLVASGREAMVAGFYHEGYEEPLLMLMRRQPVEAGLVVKGEEGSLALMTRRPAPDAPKKGRPVNYCAGFRPGNNGSGWAGRGEGRGAGRGAEGGEESESGGEEDGFYRETFSMEADAVAAGMQETLTPRIDRSAQKNLDLGLEALRGVKGPAYDRIVFNAAVQDHLLGWGARVIGLEAAVERAREAVDSGRALRHLMGYVERSKLMR
ncbi:unnamed protein product [Closterium sp. Naga37s-1]|nr:unnamed protein product [Closterium sp. Naga37s-1]